jgi:hypothetical protein
MDGVSQVSSYVNAMVIDKSWTETSDAGVLANIDIGYLNQLDTLGIKGIVDIPAVFYVWDAGPNNNCQFNCFKLRSDYQSRWNTYWQAISPNLSKIAAFYPIDEPQGSLASMNDYATVVGLIKSTTTTPILEVVTADAVINGSLSTTPPGVDWLGFDQYGCWLAAECPDKVSITDKFNKVVSIAKQTVGRKVIVVPDAIAFGGVVPATSAQQQKVQLINSYYQMCINEPLCVGMIPFLWDTYPNDGGMVIGANKMSIVEQRLKEIGLVIKFPKAGDLNSDGKVDINDYNLLMANFGKVGTGIVGDIDGNGKVDIFDYNLLVGNFGK